MALGRVWYANCMWLVMISDGTHISKEEKYLIVCLKRIGLTCAVIYLFIEDDNCENKVKD